MTMRFDMVGLFAADLAAMVAFYRDVLGLETEWNGRGSFAEFKHEGIRFSMYERAKLPNLLGREPSYPQVLNGSFELAVDLPHAEDVDREYARLVGAGAKPIYPPRDEPWGMRSSMVADPEGNLIEIGSWRKGAPPPFRLEVATIAVADLDRSRRFYEGLLGLEIKGHYEPTRWLSYKCNGDAFFAVMEVSGFTRQPSVDEIDFYVEDVEDLWRRVKDAAAVHEGLDRTPWGSLKFVIEDPDGYRLGFVQGK